MGYITAKTEGQKEYIRSIVENDITFVEGPSGTGKTYIAVGIALDWLNRPDKPIEKILLTRPTIHIGPSIGYFPGNRQEKSEEYLFPVIQTIKKIIGEKEYKSLLNQKKIEILPLPLIGGLSLDNYFIISDENQLAIYGQIKCLLTRIGTDSTMVLNGDGDQSNLPYAPCPFVEIANNLSGLNGIGHVKLGLDDIVRNGLIGQILRILVDK